MSVGTAKMKTVVLMTECTWEDEGTEYVSLTVGTVYKDGVAAETVKGTVHMTVVDGVV